MCLVQVEIIQRAQQLGSSYCSRVNYIKVIGTPIYKYVPHPFAASGNEGASPDSARLSLPQETITTDIHLQVIAHDPLSMKGGLRACSENGRHAEDDELFAELDDILWLGSQLKAVSIMPFDWLSGRSPQSVRSGQTACRACEG